MHERVTLFSCASQVSLIRTTEHRTGVTTTIILPTIVSRFSIRARTTSNFNEDSTTDVYRTSAVGQNRLLAPSHLA
jgi:hypothetical protein